MKKIENQLASQDQQILDAYAALKIAHTKVLELTGQMWNWPIAISLTSSSIGRILHLNEMYEKIIDIPGAICEFGIHFGASANVLTQIRYIQESSLANRDFFFFDTFKGFVGTNEKDGDHVQEGDFLLQQNYEEFFSHTLKIHENIRGHSNQSLMRNKSEIYNGDATETVLNFLTENPEATIALLILDMDIYTPTKKVLEALIPRLTKGSIVVLDEFNHSSYPGETVAIRELLGTHNISIRKTKYTPYSAWFIWE